MNASGFSHPETAHLLRDDFRHGKGLENTQRDLQRSWERCGTHAVPEIFARCTEAQGRDDPWASILYAARPNAIAEGLHAGSSMYAHFGGASFAEPGTTPPADGVTLLRTELLGEFPRAAEADAAAAQALILTVIERKTLDRAPGFMVNANNITADIDLSRRPLEIRLAPTEAPPNSAGSGIPTWWPMSWATAPAGCKPRWRSSAAAAPSDQTRPRPGSGNGIRRSAGRSSMPVSRTP